MKRIILSILIGLTATTGAIADDQSEFTKCLNDMANDQKLMDYLNKGNDAQNNEYADTFKDTLKFRGAHNLMRDSASNLTTSSLQDQQSHLRSTTNIETPMAYATLRYVAQNCPKFITAMSDQDSDASVFFPLVADSDNLIQFATYDDWNKSPEINGGRVAYNMKISELGKAIPGIFMFVATPTGKGIKPGQWLDYDTANSYGNFWDQKCSDHWTYWNVDNENKLSDIIREIVNVNGDALELAGETKSKRTSSYFFDLAKKSNTLIFPGMLMEEKLNSTVEEVVRTDKLYYAISFAKRLSRNMINTSCDEGLVLNVVAPYDIEETIDNFTNHGTFGHITIADWVAGGTVLAGGIGTIIWARHIIKKGATGAATTGFFSTVGKFVNRFIWPITIGVASITLADMIYETFGQDMAVEVEKVFILAQFPLNDSVKDFYFVENSANLSFDTDVSKLLHSEQDPSTSNTQLVPAPVQPGGNAGTPAKPEKPRQQMIDGWDY